MDVYVVGYGVAGAHGVAAFFGGVVYYESCVFSYFGFGKAADLVNVKAAECGNAVAVGFFELPDGLMKTHIFS